MTTTATNPTKQTPTEAVGAALSRFPDSTAATLAEAAGIGRSTAAKCLAAMEREGTARRTSGGREEGQRQADRWQLAEPGVPVAPPVVPDGSEASGEAAATEDEDAPTEDAPTEAGPTEGGTSRLGKGALRTLVLEYLAAHADDDGLSPTTVAKALGGRSSGAVGNALQKLESEGAVRLVHESPRKYRVATA